MLEELNKDGYKINGTKLQYLIAKNEMIRKNFMRYQASRRLHYSGYYKRRRYG